MMQLLSAWKESVQLFKPSNFKLFFLVTLKTFVGTLQVWLRYWWWLIGLVIAGPYIISSLLNWWIPIEGSWIVGYEPLFFMREGFSAIFVGESFSPDHGSLHASPKMLSMIQMIVGVIVTCLLSLLYTSLYLSARPSVAIKNWDYFKKYGKHVLYIIAWFSLLPKAYIITNYVCELVSWPMQIICAGMFFVIISSISLLYITFLLDSDASLKSVLLSVLRAIKMTACNLPFFILLFLLFFIVYIAVASADVVYPVVYMVGTIFITLLLACFFVNYYIKKIHDNYSFYVGN